MATLIRIRLQPKSVNQETRGEDDTLHTTYRCSPATEMVTNWIRVTFRGTICVCLVPGTILLPHRTSNRVGVSFMGI
jgi:hypothetical protein